MSENHHRSTDVKQGRHEQDVNTCDLGMSVKGSPLNGGLLMIVINMELLSKIIEALEKSSFYVEAYESENFSNDALDTSILSNEILKKLQSIKEGHS